MLGYLCAYYRYYHPVEFLTSYLNNAANEDDIKQGTGYAEKNGIKVTMPKWGISKSDYFYDLDKRIITKGLSSVKYLSERTADELYSLAKSKRYDYFMDVLSDISNETSVDSRQTDILIKIDYFSDFGNQRELLYLKELFEGLFKSGSVKKIAKTSVEDLPIRGIIESYSVGMTKSGGEAKSYTMLDVPAAMRECEGFLRSMGLSDLDDIIKVKNFEEAMGYAGYVSGKEEDRRKLYITNIFPLVRKADNKQFGYSITTKSIGSGKESRFTVVNKCYETDPIHKGDVILCKGYERNGQYFRLTSFEKIYQRA